MSDDETSIHNLYDCLIMAIQMLLYFNSPTVDPLSIRKSTTRILLALIREADLLEKVCMLISLLSYEPSYFEYFS